MSLFWSKIFIKYVPSGLITNKSALVQVMVRHCVDDKLLPEAIMIQFTEAYTCICDWDELRKPIPLYYGYMHAIYNLLWYTTKTVAYVQFEDGSVSMDNQWLILINRLYINGILCQKAFIARRLTV